MPDSVSLSPRKSGRPKARSVGRFEIIDLIAGATDAPSAAGEASPVSLSSRSAAQPAQQSPATSELDVFFQDGKRSEGGTQASTGSRSVRETEKSLSAGAFVQCASELRPLNLITSLQQQVIAILSENKRLKSENAKLRATNQRLKRLTGERDSKPKE